MTNEKIKKKRDWPIVTSEYRVRQCSDFLWNEQNMHENPGVHYNDTHRVG
jgi:hypothetical protein